MCVTSESDETIMSNDGMNSPPKDDANSTGTAEGNGQLKKGPWTSAEDAILVEYVTKHGEGNWNAVQRHTGLARCGKSCRLRWANHLRPDLKKGAFTPEEEQLIVELHAKMGNKWARMAAEMPGRTDNEIKNYWNTRMKRRQRAGLSIYPSDISFQASNDNQPKDNVSAFSSGDAHSQDAMPVNSFEIPAIQFKKLELNHPVYSPTFIDIPGGALHDIPGSAFVLHDLQSPYPNKSMLPMMHPPKRLRGPESLYAGSSATMNKTFPDGSQYEIGSFVQNVQPFTYPSAFDPSSSTVLDGSHAVVNGNPSSSESIWAMKQELPSLQTQAGNWGSPSSPLPPLEPLQTPPTEHNLSCQLSSQNSGLLDAVLHESQVMNHPRNSSDLLTPHASNMGFALMDGSTDSTQFINQTGWEPFDELTSPLRHSSSSMFSESNVEPETITGFRAKEDAAIWVPTQYNEGELTNQMFSQPELLLPPDCFDPEGKRNT